MLIVWLVFALLASLVVLEYFPVLSGLYVLASSNIL